MSPNSIRIYARLIACALLVGVLFVPGVSHGNDETARIERAKREIAEIRKRVSAAKGEAGAISAEVNALNAKIGDLDRQIRTGRHDISVLESNIRTAEANIAKLEADYQHALNASNQRAVELYKSGPMNIVSELLDAKSIGEFVQKSMVWEVAAQADGEVMIRAARTRNELSEQKADLLAIRQDLAKQKEWLEDRRDLIAEARNEKAQALASVEGRIAKDEAHIAGLEKETRALTAVLQASLSRSSGSVSRSGFIWPLRGRINQGYSRRHPALDIDGNTGNPIRASKSGTIGGASCSGGYGRCTIIDHGNGVATLYAHMSSKSVTGGFVQQGQVIGYVGCSGRCTGPHLHFEVRVNGDPQNPYRFLP